MYICVYITPILSSFHQSLHQSNQIKSIQFNPSPHPFVRSFVRKFLHPNTREGVLPCSKGVYLFPTNLLFPFILPPSLSSSFSKRVKIDRGWEAEKKRGKNRTEKDRSRSRSSIAPDSASPSPSPSRSFILGGREGKGREGGGRAEQSRAMGSRTQTRWHGVA